MRRLIAGRRLSLIGGLVAAVVLAEVLEIGPWLAAPVAALALRFGLRLDAWRWLRRGLTGFAVALGLLAGLRILVGIPYVAVAAPSPDGRALAELVETDFFVDRHFDVRLTTWWLGAFPRRRILFGSPDEGPRGGERLLWSRDSRYLLLVGPNLFAGPDARLASGDKLYLLVDMSNGLVRANATPTRHARFSLDDLRDLDFGVPLAPGRTDQRRHERCSQQHPESPATWAAPYRQRTMPSPSTIPRLAFLDERSRAFLGIVGREHRAARLVFQVKPILQ